MVQKGQFQEVNVYDFPSLSKAKAIPYGAYDIIKNKGFVNVGVSSDTGSLQLKVLEDGGNLTEKRLSKAKKLLICADSGGNNGNRINLGNIIYKNL